MRIQDKLGRADGAGEQRPLKTGLERSCYKAVTPRDIGGEVKGIPHATNKLRRLFKRKSAVLLSGMRARNAKMTLRSDHACDDAEIRLL